MLPQSLNNLLLTLADAEVFTPVWTAELLGEVERNLTSEKFGKSEQQAERRVRQMRSAFPFAEEWASGYRELVPSMTNDPKDRHVLAAAVRSGASVIVTANLKDFPTGSLEVFNIEAIHPDEFLRDLLDLEQVIVIQCMETVVARNVLPPQTIGELLESLERLTPHFVESVRALFVSPDEPEVDAVSRASSEFVELTESQVAELTPALREAYGQLLQMDPAERVRFLGHARLVSEAWKFLESVCVDGDLRRVWPNVDPELRAALARKWVQDNSRGIKADRWDEDAVVVALAEAAPEHQLWVHFERVHVSDLRAHVPSPSSWGIGSTTRMVGPDLEVLYVHDTSTLEGGVWEPGTLRQVFPILMHLVDGQWLVRNFGSDEDPVHSF